MLAGKTQPNNRGQYGRQAIFRVEASAGRFMETPIVQIYTIEDYFAERVPGLPRTA